MEQPARALHPRVRTLWRLGWLVAGIPWAAACIAALIAGLHPAVAIPAIAVLPVAGIALADAHYRRWRYEIRARDLLLARGVVSHGIALIPFDRIQYVETRQGPLDRWFRLMQVVVHTAGGSEQIPGLEMPDAELLREELSRVAGTASV